jgi:4-hydroxy-tetrahydrodipicolinate reductase
VEYTKPDSAKANVLAAVEHGSHVVVGTSGLTEQDYAEIDIAARRQARGVLGVGNFALTVVLMQKFAETAAKLIPQWEVIDYAHDDKIDAPSGTARELAARLSRARRPELTVSVEQTTGEPAARGATLAGAQVHSVRLPGFVISAEVIFGMPDQRLSIRHDSGSSARPYVEWGAVGIATQLGMSGVCWRVEYTLPAFGRAAGHHRRPSDSRGQRRRHGQRPIVCRAVRGAARHGSP